MKQFKFLSLLLIGLLLTTVIQSEAKNLTSSEASITTPETYDLYPQFFADAQTSTAHNFTEKRLYADATEPQSDESAQLTPQDIADIIEQKVQPIIETAKEEIRKAPKKGSSPMEWTVWALAAAMSLIGTLTAIFFSGSKWNLKLD